jgi:hypothetical protein
MTTPVTDKRKNDFIEKLSLILIIGAFIGGFLVLIDVRFTITLGGQLIQIGQNGFSAEVKGVVLQSMLISGFAAVVAYWLGATKQGQEQAQSVARIAEASPGVQAAAVAAAVPAAIQQVVQHTAAEQLVKDQPKSEDDK